MKKTICCILSTLIFAGNAIAQTKKSNTINPNFSEIKKMAYADSARLVTIFKDFHENPELGFMEVRTAAVVAKELKALGYEVMTGIGKTGVVGILKNGEGPVVMYRADMDCNAVKETTALPYASNKTVKKEDGTEVPVMHACGHDAHTTWMLGIAKIMMAMKSQWKGTLIMIGQPSEEPGHETEVAGILRCHQQCVDNRLAQCEWVFCRLRQRPAKRHGHSLVSAAQFRKKSH